MCFALGAVNYSYSKMLNEPSLMRFNLSLQLLVQKIQA